MSMIDTPLMRGLERVLDVSAFRHQIIAANLANLANIATATGLQPSFVRRILDGLRALAGDQVAQTAPILLCSTPARFHLRRLLEPFLPKIVVLSPLEIPSMTPVQWLGVVR